MQSYTMIFTLLDVGNVNGFFFVLRLTTHMISIYITFFTLTLTIEKETLVNSLDLVNSTLTTQNVQQNCIIFF